MFILFYFLRLESGYPRLAPLRGNFGVTLQSQRAGSVRGAVSHTALRNRQRQRNRALPTVGPAILGCRNKKKKIKRPVLASAIPFSLGPALWTPVNPGSWHPRRVLVGQVRILALHLYPPHTRGRLHETLRTRALPILRFGQDASLFLGGQWPCSLSPRPSSWQPVVSRASASVVLVSR